jgi:YegS/Rv2252/BmrU family lipid kinase
MLYFIVNETSRSGKARQIWKDIQQSLIKADVAYEYMVTQGRNHATKLASEISQRPEDNICIVVIGGDGTMNEVINGIADFDKVRFGIIPTGSGNDFGGGLDLPKSPEENLQRIISSYKAGEDSYRAVDMGLVRWGQNQKKLFGISSGIGLDAIVCKKALSSKLKNVLNKLGLGSLTYVILTIITLFSMKTADFEISYDNNKRTLKKTIFAAAMNLRAEGGGVPMAPDANPYDGKLSISSASGIPKWITFLCLPFLVAGKHTHIKGFNLVSCGEAVIHASEKMTLHADGEYVSDVTDLTFGVYPQKLRLMNLS